LSALLAIYKIPPYILGMPKTLKKPIQTVRGMRDMLPVDMPMFELIENEIRKAARDYSYGRLITPILEEYALFKRTAGEASDLVSKEMYTFEDRGGDKVVIRPELTAPAARAYVEHGLVNLPQPVKIWYLEPMLRYDRPQAGRYRQFFQGGFESFGDASPVLDAEMCIIGIRILQSLKIPVKVHINSLGDNESRTAYKKVLVAYLKQFVKKLPEDDQRRFTENPLRVLDSKEKVTKEIVADAPKITDYLSENAKEHFLKLIDYLEDLDIPYVLNPLLVRGLDYYTGTVFEFIPDSAEFITSEGKKREIPGGLLSLGGGGRYDKLIEEVGGKPTPAIGMALGIERIMNQIRERGLASVPTYKPQIFLGHIGDDARKKMMNLFDMLRSQGARVAQAFSKEGIKAQLEVAHRLGVRYSVILGQKEIVDKTILIRDMESGIQETIDFKKAVSEIMKRLSKINENLL